MSLQQHLQIPSSQHGTKTKILYSPRETDFPGGSVGKESACSAGDPRSFLGSGRAPRGGHSNPLQCSCLENPMSRGAWGATVHGAAKGWTRLKRLSTAEHSELIQPHDGAPQVAQW